MNCGVPVMKSLPDLCGVSKPFVRKRSGMMRLVTGAALMLAVVTSPVAGDVITNSTPGSSSFVVPAGVTEVRIIAEGASGGVQAGGAGLGGAGAVTSGVFAVTAGDTIRYVVGQQPSGGTGFEAGGGGSTGVFINGTLVTVAGGGSGYDNTQVGGGQGGRAAEGGQDGPARGPCGITLGGTGGAGGSGGNRSPAGCGVPDNGGGGGGGINSAGQEAGPGGGTGGGAADLNALDGLSVAPGGLGDNDGGAQGANGGSGFTGGGGADPREAGGGGGYSGGAGANESGQPGGGGSFVVASALFQSKTNGANSTNNGNGSVEIAFSRLTVVKAVVNDDAGTATAASFTLRLAATLGDVTTATAFSSGSVVDMRSGGATNQYTLSEDALAGYTQTANTCAPLTHAVANIGTNYTCTITNDDNDVSLIVADDDDFSATPVNGATGGTAGDAYAGDTLNGVQVTAAQVTPTVTTPATPIGGGPVPVLATSGATEGQVTVPAGTPAGTYTIAYEICETLNPGNCDDAVVTVVVDPPAIVADDDDFTAVPIDPLTGGTAGNVLGNDTLNGAAFDPADVTIAVTDAAGIPGLTISPAGDLIIPPGVAAGTYAIEYEICEVLNPANCDTAIATVVVGVPGATGLVDDISAGNIPGTAVTLRVLRNDNDPANIFDRSTLTIVGTAGPGAPLVVPGEGTWTVELASGSITFTPEPGFLGNPTPIRYQVTDIFGNLLAPAAVVILYEFNAAFICSDVIGKVFDDKNQDGQQDEGEAGIPAARLATVNGDIITTDEYGRYSVPCAAIPQDIGSTFLLKLDPRSLPTGYRLTTENPKTVRLTQGTMRRMNFGVTVSNVVRVDLTSDAFDASGQISAELDKGLKVLVASVAKKPSTLRISYFVDGGSVEVAKKRLDLVEARLRALWRGKGSYQLSLEKTIVERK